MTALPRSPSPYLPVFTETTGAKKDAGPNGHTLANATVYYVGATGDSGLAEAVMITWDSSVVMEITYEDSLHPTPTLYADDGRQWTPEDPPGSYVAVVGGTSTGMVVTVPGGTAGSCIFHLSGAASLHGRIKLDVTTGGNVQALAHARQ